MAAIDADLDFTERDEIQTRCGDDNVALQFFAAAQLDAVLREGLDFIRDNRSFALFDRLEQVSIGNEAHALIPGVVARA